jgi:hypothetical protein
MTKIDVDDEAEVVVLRMPAWAWDILLETLELDRESSAFDRELRLDIGRALDTIEEV